MANENEKIEEKEETKNPEEQLADVMKNMVPKTKLEEAERKYNNLYSKILNGEFSGRDDETPPQETEVDKENEAKQLLKDFIGHKIHTPTDHVKGLLKLDDYFTAKGKRSIFEATEGERDLNGAYQEAQRVREFLEDALETSNGNDNMLMAKIQDGLRDVVR